MDRTSTRVLRAVEDAVRYPDGGACRDRVVAFLRTFGRGRASIQVIAHELDAPVETVRHALEDLVRRRLVTPSRRGRDRTIYQLAERAKKEET